jgi:hypothetical protein
MLIPNWDTPKVVFRFQFKREDFKAFGEFKTKVNEEKSPNQN